MQQHHRPFGGSYASFSSSTVIRFLDAVLPKDKSATSDLQVMGLLVCPASEVAKLREGPTAKPAHCTPHSFVRVLLNSESELSLHSTGKCLKEKTRHSYLLGLHKAEQPVLHDFYVLLSHMILL